MSVINYVRRQMYNGGMSLKALCFAAHSSICFGLRLRRNDGVCNYPPDNPVVSATTVELAFPDDHGLQGRDRAGILTPRRCARRRGVKAPGLRASALCPGTQKFQVALLRKDWRGDYGLIRTTLERQARREIG